MPQLDYNEMESAIKGMLADSGFANRISRSAGENVKQVATLALTTVIAAVAQVVTFTVATAADGDNFEIWIDGVLCASGVTAGTDKTVHRDQIEALLEANAYFAANFVWADSSTDAGTITALQPGRGFSVYAEVDATTAFTIVDTTPNVVGTAIHITLDGHDVYFYCDSTTEEDERDSLLAVLEADDFVTSQVDMAATGVGPYNIVFTAKTAGLPFSLTVVNENELGAPGSGTIALTATTANITGNPIPFGMGLAQNVADADKVAMPSATGFLFAGVAQHKHKAQLNAGGEAQYETTEAVSVITRGRVWVWSEQAVAPNDPVYLRHTVNGSLVPGDFRKDADSAKADQITAGARWMSKTAGAGLAVLDLNLP